MNFKTWKQLSLALAAAVTTTSAIAVPYCDERINIANPARVPFNTVATIRFDSDCAHDLKSWGTGALVGPHMVLTAGHVVYNRNAGMKNQTCNYIQPGAFHDSATNQIVYPYGERTISDTKYKKTNNKWADQSYSPKRNVDYGAIHLVCPFEDINTYMPMVFDYESELVNMSGYPIDDLPTSADGGDQWRDAGNVIATLDRQMEYDIRSTGGASGAPVWEFTSGSQTRRLIGVNTAHSNQCNGLGPRLVWQNEQLINDWLDWRPTLNEKLTEGCANLSFQSLDLSDLIKGSNSGEFTKFSSKKLRLTKRPEGLKSRPSHRVYQYIQNNLYVWEEFLLTPNNAESTRYLKLIQPEKKWLEVEEAQALLSASATWRDAKPSGKHETRGQLGQTKTFSIKADTLGEEGIVSPDKTSDVDLDEKKP